MRVGVVFFSIIALSIVGYISCSREKPAEPEKTKEYLMPLKVGNSWKYKALRIDPATGDTTEVGELQITIIGTKTIGNSQYFEFDDGSVAQNRNDGLFIAGYNPDLGGFYDDLFFKYPVNSGQIYTYTTIDEGVQVRIKVTTQTITVPAGTFNCYAYQFIDVPFESIIYFSPGVGLIYVKNFDTEGEHLILLSYDLK